MEKNSVAEPAVAEWDSPILFVPKQDRSFRFYVDFCQLKDVTVRDSRSVPRMVQCINDRGEANLFSTLDANVEFWQAGRDDKDVYKTAFVTCRELYEYTKIPFALKITPVTFQRSMDVILCTLKWEYALVYIDETILFLKKPKQYLRLIEEVLKLQNNGEWL